AWGGGLGRHELERDARHSRGLGADSAARMRSATGTGQLDPEVVVVADLEAGRWHVGGKVADAGAGDALHLLVGGVVLVRDVLRCRGSGIDDAVLAEGRW